MRATNLKCLLAVSVILLTIVCTTVPAWARVDITAAQVGNTDEVIISFDSRSEPNPVRAFALDVRPDNNANVTEVTDTNECMKDTNPAYSDWVALGRPDCWCYARQCRGDINGIKHGPFWVQVFDLDLFKLSFNKTDTQLPPGGECADLNHIKHGPFRVKVFDLDIFKNYFNKPEAAVRECDDTHINFWIEP